ncbi:MULTISPECIES: iron uptake porin [Cyanophyceae]|uniref:iron uptake porin n=1 Tax=Cyanophyceae TaxID=3028117 RepID=UPI0016898939|nr:MULTISPECIES: iron uptake porin [Cyanophyceae]MBD1915830.1 carbohydrate porin [Phormidium sp. FACHB-77]MBD2030496.1 carbohydrate porin [Phormidium sp. FACHB-322]MBD2053498.1 carbohydrate porin [Leptolyngbya sp. FACHB-60]
MSKLFWQSLLAMPAALGAAVAVSGSAIAAEAATPLVSDFDQDSVQLAQITSVSELTDVLPSDWAFQALQSLVENYGCIQGYPDRTFRGQRSLTRFEFAAGLNSCLDVIATLIAQSGINPEDLATIRRLQEEFQAELATLRGRVDALEAEVTTLRAQQFSTTTKLRGQADFHLITPFDGISGEANTSVANRARLNFDSSFTGDDRLRIRLQAGEGNAISPRVLGGLANARGSDYNVTVDDFYYRVPVGSRITLTASARGLQGDDWVTDTIVPFDGPSVAQYGEPAFYTSGGSSSNGAGAGISISLTDSIVFDAGYTAGGPGAFTPNVGIFAAANQSYIAQLSFLSDGFLDAGIVYMHNDRSINFQGGLPGGTDTYAGLLNLDFGGFFIAGHGAYQTFNGGNDFSWTAGLGLNDFGVEGSQLGIYGGQLPQVTGTTNNPLLIEGYYEVPFNEFLTITPAVIYGDTNLGGGTDETGFWGVLRATFRF